MARTPWVRAISFARHRYPVVMSDVPYRIMTTLACGYLAVNLIRGLWPRKVKR